MTKSYGLYIPRNDYTYIFIFSVTSYDKITNKRYFQDSFFIIINMVRNICMRKYFHCNVFFLSNSQMDFVSVQNLNYAIYTFILYKYYFPVNIRFLLIEIGYFFLSNYIRLKKCKCTASALFCKLMRFSSHKNANSVLIFIIIFMLKILFFY